MFSVYPFRILWGKKTSFPLGITCISFISQSKYGCAKNDSLFSIVFFLTQFKVRLSKNIYMSNLFISILALTSIIIALIILFYWDVLYRICFRLMVKYNTLLNWVLEILLFPGVIFLRFFLSLLDPLYKVLLHIKPQVKFSLVQYFWHKKSVFSFQSNYDMSFCFSSHFVQPWYNP